MQKPLRILLICLFGLVGMQSAKADSPITSTEFWKAYESHKMVNYASEQKNLDRKIAKYLLKKRKPIAIKAAIINAIGWKFEGKNLAGDFRLYLSDKYKKAPDKLVLDEMRGDELMCLGYMMVMGDYFNPAPAVPILKKAAAKLPDSYTVHLMLALTEAQVAFDSDWCKVYTLVDDVYSSEELNRDMSREAEEIIMEYISLYQDECK